MRPASLPYVLDALIALTRAESGHRDPEATTSGIPVFDGPQYGVTSDRAPVWLAIGWSGDPDSPEEAADAGQVVGPISADRGRDEEGSIRCRTQVTRGDRSSMKQARDLGFAEMAVIEAICRTNPTLGLPSSWMRYAWVSSRYSMRQEYRQGPLFTLDFIVGFKARI